MKISSGLATAIVAIILIVAGALYFAFSPKVAAPTTTAPSTATPSVTYSCTSGSIAAVYGTSSVALSLSDGRSLALPQVRSGSGIRYESTSTPGTDIVFAGEGDNAFLTENDKTTYANCVAGSNTSVTQTGGSSLKTFTDQGKTFTLMYPGSLTLSGGGVGYTQDWMQNATTSGMLLVKITIPQSFEPKTNFGDATFTVGTSADPAAITGCTTYAESGGGAPEKSVVTINGVTYTKFITNDAGAGNIYQTTSYRTIRHNQCYAIEYTIHSSNIENYSPNQGITAFDQTKVQGVLEQIVQSFKFL